MRKLVSLINTLQEKKKRLIGRWVEEGKIYRLKRDLRDIAINHNCGPYLDSESNKDCKNKL